MKRAARIALILMVLGLAAGACAVDPNGSAVSSGPPSPAQGYYAAKAAYAPVLKAAAAYRMQCRAKPAELRESCMAVVDQLRGIDLTVQGYDLTARQGLGYGDDAMLLGAVAGLELVREELERMLVAEGAFEQRLHPEVTQ